VRGGRDKVRGSPAVCVPWLLMAANKGRPGPPPGFRLATAVSKDGRSLTPNRAEGKQV